MKVANIVFCPAPGLEMPDYVLRKLISEYGGGLKKVTPDSLPSLARAAGDEDWSGAKSLDAIYTTPSGPHQLTLLPDINVRINTERGVDALYVTRFQKERSEESGREPARYPMVDKKLLKGKEFKRTLVMHPLPRVDELARELDADPRSMYFKQAAQGVPLRMALVALILGAAEVEIPSEHDTGPKAAPGVYAGELGVRCENPACISVHESHYIKPEFRILDSAPFTLRCVYCDHERGAAFVGNSASGIYHPPRQSFIGRIKQEHRILFASEEDAQKIGFRRAKECLW
jgi:hypothetical protein